MKKLDLTLTSGAKWQTLNKEFFNYLLEQYPEAKNAGGLNLS